MIRQLFSLAIRRIIHAKSFSVILVSGLALVLTCGFFVGSYVQSERNYESHYSKRDRLYSLFVHYENEDQNERFEITSHGLNKLMQEIPEIEHIVQLYEMDATVKKEGKVFKEDQFYHTDDIFWNAFDLQFIGIAPESPLSNPQSVVISEGIAIKYFGHTNVQGQLLNINLEDYRIAGVFKDLPYNTYRRYGAILSHPPEQKNYEIGSFWCETYLLLHENTSLQSFQEHLATFDEVTFQPLMEKLFEDEGFRVWHSVVPIAQVRSGSVGYLSSSVLIILFGLLIVILAVNTANLSFIGGLGRLKEIGIRKVMGITRIQLASLQLFESIIFSLLAWVIAVTLIQLLGSSIEIFLGHTAQIGSFNAYSLFLTAVTLILFTFVYNLSILPIYKNDSSELLRKKTRIGTKQTLNQWILGLQFGLSFLVIAGAWIIFQQYQFMASREMGFERTSRLFLSLPFDNDKMKKGAPLAEELAKIPGVEAVAIGHRPGYIPFVSGYSLGNETGPGLISGTCADHRMIDFLGLEIVQGSNFEPSKNPSYKDDQKEVIINEAFARLIGLESPVGQKITYDGEATIVGVVRDFHLRSLRFEIEPFLIEYNKDRPHHVLLRTDLTNFDQLEEVWYQFFPNEPFSITPLDQEIQAMYDQELKLSQLMGVIAAIGIFISGIGLYAISYFSQLTRIKEIGVRKVLGASIAHLITLLTSTTFKVIAVSICLSAPTCYLLISSWLEQYHYRIPVGLSVFVIPIIFLIMIAALSMGLHTVKNALSNPSDSLRYE